MLSTAETPTPDLHEGRVIQDGRVVIEPGMTLPLPDEVAAMATRQRLSTIDIGVAAPTVAALGALAEAVVFVASVQGSSYPRPLLSTRVVLLTGAHAGGVVAGPAPDPKNSIPLQHLAITVGAGIVTLEWQPASAAIELEDAITPDQMNTALQAGWDEAERAADEGIELLVLAAGGAGAATAATAVVAAITGVEAPALLARVITPNGWFDDNAWMARCVALRDALHRVRKRAGDATTVLSALGGADIAAATGLLLGAAYRKTPVMIDGPVGAAAALLANDICPQSRSWLLLPDTGRQPAVRLAAEALELRPWLDLWLDLGEGASALAALPMLQTALTLAGVGEPVEDQPLTRYDSSGNQVFVGIAKPVEPAEDESADGLAAADSTDAPADQATSAPSAGTTSASAPGKRSSSTPAGTADGTVPDEVTSTGTTAKGGAAGGTPADGASSGADKPQLGHDAADAAAKPAPKTGGKATKAPATKPEPAKEPAKGTPTRTVTKAPPPKTTGSKPAQTKTVALKNVPSKDSKDSAAKDNSGADSLDDPTAAGPTVASQAKAAANADSAKKAAAAKAEPAAAEATETATAETPPTDPTPVMDSTAVTDSAAATDSTVVANSTPSDPDDSSDDEPDDDTSTEGSPPSTAPRPRKRP